MKANELMIGDWISYNGISNKISPADFGIDEGHTKWRNEIKPISLTPEILEKNGFESHNDCQHFKGLLLDDFAIEISFWDTSTTLRIGKKCDDMLRVGYDWLINGVPINCVHTLQHALRLCGIDKEIKL